MIRDTADCDYEGEPEKSWISCWRRLGELEGAPEKSEVWTAEGAPEKSPAWTVDVAADTTVLGEPPWNMATMIAKK